MFDLQKEQNIELQEYSEYLDYLVEQAQNVIFLNSSSDHASMVMSRIFKHSDKEVFILAGNLNGDVSGNEDYITELLDFLNRGGNLKILVSSYDPLKPPHLLDYLRAFSSPNLEVKETDIRFFLADTKEEVHFTVGSKKVDSLPARMFRLEHNINKYLASGNFNDPETSTMLYNQFIKAFNSDRSKIINLS